MSLDILIKNVALGGAEGLRDLGIANGRFVSLEQSLSLPAALVLDAEGRMAVPGFVEPHIHLDKAAALGDPQRSPDRRRQNREAALFRSLIASYADEDAKASDDKSALAVRDRDLHLGARIELKAVGFDAVAEDDAVFRHQRTHKQPIRLLQLPVDEACL